MIKMLYIFVNIINIIKIKMDNPEYQSKYESRLESLEQCEKVIDHLKTTFEKCVTEHCQ
jgi:hypothetical protein